MECPQRVTLGEILNLSRYVARLFSRERKRKRQAFLLKHVSPFTSSVNSMRDAYFLGSGRYVEKILMIEEPVFLLCGSPTKITANEIRRERDRMCQEAELSLVVGNTNTGDARLDRKRAIL